MWDRPLNRTATPAGTFWLSAAVLAALAEDAARHAPRETGGVLLGYWSAAGDEPVVTDFVGPGPGAVHERGRFVPDHAYHVAEVARRYAASGRRLTYLGDWHTHPGGAADLSRTDLATLARIAGSPAARAPRPVMAVLAPGPAWLPSAWRGELVRPRFGRPRLTARPMHVEVFEAVAPYA